MLTTDEKGFPHISCCEGGGGYRPTAEGEKGEEGGGETFNREAQHGRRIEGACAIKKKEKHGVIQYNRCHEGNMLSVSSAILRGGKKGFFDFTGNEGERKRERTKSERRRKKRGLGATFDLPGGGEGLGVCDGDRHPVEGSTKQGERREV